MTSLLDTATFPAHAFADLYLSRWRIEEAFKRIKHRLNLEHLSGISWPAAHQDFGAKMLCDNLNALAVFCATEHSLDAQAQSNYRINRTYAPTSSAVCPGGSPNNGHPSRNFSPSSPNSPRISSASSRDFPNPDPIDLSHIKPSHINQRLDGCGA